MTLRQYLEATGESVLTFSRRIGVHPSTVFRYLTEDRGAVVRKIVSGTKGKVTADDLLGIRRTKAA